MKAEDHEAAVAAPAVGRAYGAYGMVILLIVYMLNLLDRQIVTIVAEPIKRDLGLLDWQIGMMGGLAFALFYSTLGLPIARLAERANRPVIIGVSAIVWSAFTVACGLAQNFVQLVLARFGVGVGEAGCLPASLSLVSDYVPKERRAFAISFIMAGAPLGSLLGMVVGGFVAAQWGWRSAFFLLGVPGIVMGAVTLLTLIEPRNGKSRLGAAPPAPPPSFGEVARVLWSKRAYRFVAAGTAVKGFINFGFAAFLGSFYLRNHELALTDLAAHLGLRPLALLGMILGLALGLTGLIGTLLGGYVTDRLGKRDIRYYAIVPATAILVSTPLYIAALMADSFRWSIALLLVPAMLSTTWYGPCYAMVQGLVVPQMRATASAIVLLITNLIGLGLGPVMIGMTSDLLAAAGHGSGEGLRLSLVIFVLVGFLAAYFFWLARTSLRAEMVS